MKDVYRRQIDAILSGDIATLDEMYEADFASQIDNEHSLAAEVWAATGAYENSIFSNVEGCGVCLTMLKSGYAGHTETAEKMVIGLKLREDDLIPSGGPGLKWNPTEEVLERFAKLREFSDTFIGDSK